MIMKSRKFKFPILAIAAFGAIFALGGTSEISAQRDPFAKPGGGRVAAPSSGTPSTPRPEKPKPAAPGPVAIPKIEDRIAYYKRLRESAAQQNQPIPKVTSVLTLDEMSVTGIFRTPRGYAAMVEAKPIRLSYTIYPGEKFFDGQLVAIEENRLVFRRVTKWTNGKFVTSEENKALRQYTVDQEVQGTAPAETNAKTETPANASPAPVNSQPQDASKPAPTVVVSSPLEEMINQPAASEDAAKAKKSAKDKKGKPVSSAKTEKKPVKVAKNQDQ